MGRLQKSERRPKLDYESEDMWSRPSTPSIPSTRTRRRNPKLKTRGEKLADGAWNLAGGTVLAVACIPGFGQYAYKKTKKGVTFGTRSVVDLFPCKGRRKGPNHDRDPYYSYLDDQSSAVRRRHKETRNTTDSTTFSQSQRNEDWPTTPVRPDIPHTPATPTNNESSLSTTPPIKLGNELTEPKPIGTLSLNKSQASVAGPQTKKSDPALRRKPLTSEPLLPRQPSSKRSREEASLSSTPGTVTTSQESLIYHDRLLPPIKLPGSEESLSKTTLRRHRKRAKQDRVGDDSPVNQDGLFPLDTTSNALVTTPSMWLSRRKSQKLRKFKSDEDIEDGHLSNRSVSGHLSNGSDTSNKPNMAMALYTGGQKDARLEIVNPDILGNSKSDLFRALRGDQGTVSLSGSSIKKKALAGQPLVIPGTDGTSSQSPVSSQALAKRGEPPLHDFPTSPQSPVSAGSFAKRESIISQPPNISAANGASPQVPASSQALIKGKRPETLLRCASLASSVRNEMSPQSPMQLRNNTHSPLLNQAPKQITYPTPSEGLMNSSLPMRSNTTPIPMQMPTGTPLSASLLKLHNMQNEESDTDNIADRTILQHTGRKADTFSISRQAKLLRANGRQSPKKKQSQSRATTDVSSQASHTTRSRSLSSEDDDNSSFVCSNSDCSFCDHADHSSVSSGSSGREKVMRTRKLDSQWIRPTGSMIESHASFNSDNRESYDYINDSSSRKHVLSRKLSNGSITQSYGTRSNGYSSSINGSQYSNSTLSPIYRMPRPNSRRSLGSHETYDTDGYSIFTDGYSSYKGSRDGEIMPQRQSEVESEFITPPQRWRPARSIDQEGRDVESISSGNSRRLKTTDNSAAHSQSHNAIGTRRTLYRSPLQNLGDQLVLNRPIVKKTFEDTGMGLDPRELILTQHSPISHYTALRSAKTPSGNGSRSRASREKAESIREQPSDNVFKQGSISKLSAEALSRSSTPPSQSKVSAWMGTPDYTDSEGGGNYSGAGTPQLPITQKYNRFIKRPTKRELRPRDSPMLQTSANTALDQSFANGNYLTAAQGRNGMNGSPAMRNKSSEKPLRHAESNESLDSAIRLQGIKWEEESKDGLTRQITSSDIQRSIRDIKNQITKHGTYQGNGARIMGYEARKKQLEVVSSLLESNIPQNKASHLDQLADGIIDTMRPLRDNLMGNYNWDQVAATNNNEWKGKRREIASVVRMAKGKSKYDAWTDEENKRLDEVFGLIAATGNYRLHELPRTGGDFFNNLVASPSPSTSSGSAIESNNFSRYF